MSEERKLKIDLHEQKTCIYGLQGGGKTVWAKYNSKHFSRPIVFQVNADDGWIELKNMTVYSADRSNLKNIQEEFKIFIRNCHKWAMDGKIDLIIIDDADLFIQTNFDLDVFLTDLMLNHRHIGREHRQGKGVALWLLTRRPQDIPTKIVEQSKYNIIFALEGKNAIDRFGEIRAELPDMIKQLDFDRHNFITKEISKAPVICAPINLEAK